MAKSKFKRKQYWPEAREAMIRVDQAGEYGARRIYQGQLRALREQGSPSKYIAEIEHMAAQEDVHLARFNQLMVKHKVRPTLLTPLWHVAGYTLGYVTAKMGVSAAMACTVAVEEVIDQHYEQQKQTIDNRDAELKHMIHTFQQEECEHRDKAHECGAEQAPLYPLLRRSIQAVSRLAIKLSTKI